MAVPAVTYTFTNSTTADATQVNQNFTDLVNSLTDGLKDLTIAAITCTGNVSFQGNTTVGNASGDDFTVTASLASSIPIKTTNTYDIGSSTLGLRAAYFGANSQTVKLQGSSSMSATWTFTFPVSAGTARDELSTDGAGVTSWVPIRRQPGDVTNYSIATSISGTSLVITVKGADGNNLSSTNQVDAVFRSETLTTGTPVLQTLTANISITLASGDTLGIPQATSRSIYVYLCNVATTEVGVSAMDFGPLGRISTTALTGGADTTNSVIYTTTGQTNKGYRRLGRVVVNRVAASDWATGDVTQISLDPLPSLSEDLPIIAIYESNQGQNIGNSATIIDYEDKIIDTHNSVTTGASWNYVCPKSGFYEVYTTNLYAGATYAAGNTVVHNLHRNSNATGLISYEAFVVGSLNPNPHGTVLVNASAGDQLDARGLNDRVASGTSLGTNADRNRIYIKYVGKGA